MDERRNNEKKKRKKGLIDSKEKGEKRWDEEGGRVTEGPWHCVPGLDVSNTLSANGLCDRSKRH